jgi:HPr kinase/phosphorylase
MKLKLVAHLEGPHADGRNPAERLPLADMSEDVLGVTIRRVVIPVAAGRNLAVLIEAAVRNHILQLRGVNSMDEFMARQNREIEGGKFDGGPIHAEPDSDD